MREWTEIHRQLLQMLGDATRKRLLQEKNDFELSAADENSAGNIFNPKYAAIHRSLLSGFLSGVSYLSGEHEFTGAGNIKFYLWPGSGLFDHKPKWCLTAELVETARRYGRTNARIDPGWIEPLAGHVVNRSYHDPHWHKKNGTVMAFERVSLFGLPIVQKRRVKYGKINPVEAHEIFIRDGLLHDRSDQRWRHNAADLSGQVAPATRHGKRKQQGANQFAFFVHNQNVLAEIDKLAAKTRSNEYVVEESLLREFYRNRVDEQVYDWYTLRSWIQKNRDAASRLQMSVAGLLGDVAQAASAGEFPNDMDMGSFQLPVTYKFAPGDADDGVSVIVPQDAVGHLHSGRTGWLVPGLLADKITALIRSLPKSLRRNFIPAPDTARQVASMLNYGEGDFFEQIVRCLNEYSDERVAPDDFQLDKLPDHLRLNIKIIDDEGAVRTQGRDLAQLRREIGATVAEQITTGIDPQWHRDEIVEWDFEQLPRSLSIERAGIRIPVYPAVVDAGDSVQLRLYESGPLAKRTSINGIARLYTLQCKKSLRSQLAWLPEFGQMALHAASLIPADVLRLQLRDLISRRAFLDGEKGVPRTAAEFAARLENGTEHIGMATQDVAKLLPRLFAAYHESRLAIEGSNIQLASHALPDVKQQLSHLVGDQFLVRTPWRWLNELPRYLRAITYRLERLSAGALDKDIDFTYEIGQLWDQYQAQWTVHKENRIFDSELEMYRWMLEEYRVSCFAQSLGTSFSISGKRLGKQWAKVTR